VYQQPFFHQHISGSWDFSTSFLETALRKAGKHEAHLLMEIKDDYYQRAIDFPPELTLKKKLKIVEKS
jgi:hypothetical protein